MSSLSNITTLIGIILTSTLSAQSISRVEPPMWWIGMRNPALQLLVYGDQIASTRPAISAPGVTLKTVHQLTSPNYLFIDLEIGQQAEPGLIELVFTREGEEVLRYSYELKAREAGSADRQGFNNSDVMYLITPDRFANGSPANDEEEGLQEGLNRAAPFGRHGGDIQGIKDHLDYIKEMGFTSIWLNPILENDQPEFSYHGYATTDYYRVDPRFGTNEEYADLSREAKAMGIKMIMDVIVNHCGSEHWWMKDPPSSDWIHHYDQEYQQTSHRKATLVDPYVSESDRNQMVQGWFVPTMPDLNQKNPFMSTYLIQNSIWWIEYADLGGLRQDTYSYPYREFMTDWTCRIMEEYPHFNIVGEEWVENSAIIAYWQEGKLNPDGYSSCLPSLMDFPMTMTLHKTLRDQEGWSALYENLANDFLYAHPEKMVIFPDNHDMSRIFTQVNEDYDLFKLAIAYILTMRGTPQLYYGTEILMSNKGTDSHGVIRSDFPGGWAGDTVNVFTQDGLSQTQLEALAFIKTMLKWRQKKSVVHDGDLTHFVPENGIYVYFRHDNHEKIMVILNKNEERSILDLGRFSEFLSNVTAATDILTGAKFNLNGTLPIPAKSPLILELE